jgi:hypothetical protein
MKSKIHVNEINKIKMMSKKIVIVMAVMLMSVASFG